MLRKSYIPKPIRFNKNTSNIEYPSNMGQLWTEKEELLLLDELQQNNNIMKIAENHRRTPGGITSRIRYIAYKMYVKNIPMEEIIKKTKLDHIELNEVIEKQEAKKKFALEKREAKKINPKDIEIKSQYKNLVFTIENKIEDIQEIKNDIKNIKSTLFELTEMINAIYEFEKG